MSDLPSIKAKDFIRVISALGYQLDRQRGSHAIYKDNSGNRVVVPMHSGKDLKPGTLAGIIKDIGLEKADFFRRLREL
ncbi:MAG: type II toxin-antitoxin system HicA family toxin [Thermosynechococcaceae cyanobacterium]